MVIGVLALQGAFREHKTMLERIGCKTRLVRHPAELEGLAGLILPGGESTAIAKLMIIHGMYIPIREAYACGMAVFGTCAGAILLAREIEGGRPDQEALKIMDVRVRRNAYGRQIDSFETTVPFFGVPGKEVRGVFIRAPRFDRLGAHVEILSCSDKGEPLAVREAHALAVAFHPELTEDTRVHRYFIDCVVGSA
ncbi:MAG: pyridoxal 5'-phosphate synthase glutaminase subunit PdxT [Raoultibacter sp.]